MPTPTFTFRLPDSERASLVEMSKVFGSPNPRAFLREMLGAMCSGDPRRVEDFNRKLIHAAGEQLVLKLHAPLRALTKPVPLPKKGRKKRRGRHGTT